MDSKLTRAYKIIDSMVQKNQLKFRDHITGWKKDLAMEAYTLCLEFPKLTIKEAVEKAYRQDANKLRLLNNSGYAVTLPFASVRNSDLNTGTPVPENISNTERNIRWKEKFESIKPVLKTVEIQIVQSLLDNRSIAKIAIEVGVCTKTIQRAIARIINKVEGIKYHG